MNLSISLLLLFALCIGFVLYLNAGRNAPPSRLQTIVATAWLLLRRIVAFSGALLFLAGVIYVPFTEVPLGGIEPWGVLTRVGVALLYLALAALCVWVGIYGSGTNRFDWRDDVELHRRNKRRFHWRW